MAIIADKLGDVLVVARYRNLDSVVTYAPTPPYLSIKSHRPLAIKRPQFHWFSNGLYITTEQNMPIYHLSTRTGAPANKHDSGRISHFWRQRHPEQFSPVRSRVSIAGFPIYPMGLPWVSQAGVSHGSSMMGIPRVSHGSPMGLPWVSHGSPMDLPWVSHAWVFHCHPWA